jgi:hypothetical protein
MVGLGWDGALWQSDAPFWARLRYTDQLPFELYCPGVRQPSGAQLGCIIPDFDRECKKPDLVGYSPAELYLAGTEAQG